MLAMHRLVRLVILHSLPRLCMGITHCLLTESLTLITRCPPSVTSSQPPVASTAACHDQAPTVHCRPHKLTTQHSLLWSTMELTAIRTCAILYIIVCNSRQQVFEPSLGNLGPEYESQWLAHAIILSALVKVGLGFRVEDH